MTRVNKMSYRALGLIFIWMILLIIPAAYASDAENFKPFNFIGIKAGIVQPTPLHGNTGLDVGKPTSAAGINMGIKFHKILSADIEYMHRGKSNVQTSTPGETEYPTYGQLKVIQ